MTIRPNLTVAAILAAGALLSILALTIAKHGSVSWPTGRVASAPARVKPDSITAPSAPRVASLPGRRPHRKPADVAAPVATPPSQNQAPSAPAQPQAPVQTQQRPIYRPRPVTKPVQKAPPKKPAPIVVAPPQ